MKRGGFHPYIYQDIPGEKKKKDFLFAEERSGVALLLSLSHLAPRALHAVLQGGDGMICL